MKVLSNLRFLFMVAAASFMLVSCGDDLGTGGGTGGTGGGSEVQSTLNLEAGPDLVTSVTSVALGDSFEVNLVATAGDDAMFTLEIFEDGVSIDSFNRIEYNDVAAVANPVLLLDDSKTNVDVIIKIQAHTEVGTRRYTYTIVDDGGDSESVSVDVTTVGTPPALTVNGSAVLPALPGSLNNVSLTTAKGSGAIVSIGLAIDGVVGAFDDLEFDGVACTSNPHLVGGAYADGFDAVPFTFRAPMDAGSYVYTITVEDEFGLQSTSEFTVVVGTPVETLMGILFNAEGPMGTGGLDLDNGMSTGSADIEAEIKDQGFNTTGDWAQLIAPVNGSRLYLLTAGEDGVSESFTFASIDSKETLAGLNGSGFEVAISGTVLAGQIYLVERDGAVYAFEVEEVNVIQADNSDNYVVNIKK